MPEVTLETLIADAQKMLDGQQRMLDQLARLIASQQLAAEQLAELQSDVAVLIAMMQHLDGRLDKMRAARHEQLEPPNSDR